MKTQRLHSLLFAPIAVACLLLATAVHAEDAPTVVKFSDPSKPGTLKINLGRGELRISGSDTSEVTVRSSAKNEAPRRKDGLRVLTSAASFSTTEKDNTITLNAADVPGRNHGDLTIVVPRATSVIVQNAWGGDITASGINGDLEVASTNADLKFEDIGGGVIASTANGDIKVSLRELRADKPLSFTSMSGEIELRVPAATKANVRFRTQNGSVATDFDEKALVTKTESSPTGGRFSGNVWKGDGPNFLSVETQLMIQDATRMAVDTANEVVENVKAGLEASKARANADQARVYADQARARSDQAKNSNSADKSQNVERSNDMAARPLKPPVPPLPMITGGKLVTGALNGGGTEINVATMNGDILLKQK